MIDRVVLAFEGQEIPLSLDSGEGHIAIYTATFTAPSASSWSNPDHVYIGTVTATDTEGKSHSLTAGLRVRETVPPSIRFTAPMENWFFPTLTARVVFEVSDAESGIESVNAKLDGKEVTVRGNDGEYTFIGWSAQGRHELSVTATDHDGNTATAARHFAAAGLITDRTLADVLEVEALCEKANRGDVESFIRLEETDLRGAYNASDMNRVGFATECVGAVWKALGYTVPRLTSKQDWIGGLEDFDTPDCDQISAYLKDSKIIHDLIPAHFVELQGTRLPDAPASLAGFDHEAANDIEKILYLATTTADFIRKNTSVWASGEIASGEA